MNTLRDQRETEHPRVYVTDRVRAFIAQFTNQEEQVLAIPGMRIVDPSGQIEVARRVHAFDGCHPYQYTASDEQPGYWVESVTTLVHSFGGAMAHVKTVDGWTISITNDSLERFMFDTPEQVLPPKTERELQLEQLLLTTSGLDCVSAEQLVGYENNLRVRLTEPFLHPITLPKSSEYGSPQSIDGMRVLTISVAGDEHEKSAILVVNDESRSWNQTVGPVPLSALELSIEAIERTPEWLAAISTHLAQARQHLEDIAPLVEEFNATVPPEGLPIFTWAGADQTSAITAQHGNGQLQNKRFVTIKSPLGVKSVGLAHRLVIDPDTGQIYAVNTETTEAFSIASLQVRPKHSWEYIAG